MWSVVYKTFYYEDNKYKVEYDKTEIFEDYNLFLKKVEQLIDEKIKFDCYECKKLKISIKKVLDVTYDTFKME